MPPGQRLPHLFIQGQAQIEKYEAPGGGSNKAKLPERERDAHARKLLANLEHLRETARIRREELLSIALPAKKGTHVEFASEPGFDLELKSLEDRRAGIELVAVRQASDREGALLATVFVPEGKLGSLEKKIREYRSKDTAKGKPRNQKLVEKIADIRLATLRSFWTDLPELLPEKGQAIWWEIWLCDPSEAALGSFQQTAQALGIRLRETSLEFPSTRVLLAWGTLVQFADSIDLIDSIAELRRAKEVPSAFLEMPPRELGEWIDDLVSRARPPATNASRICLLDTGVNAGHPLLAKAMARDGLHAFDPDWGLDDRDGHGTGMAGLMLYGDLSDALMTSEELEIPAWLESVKILPPPPRRNKPELYGSITQRAVYRVEVEEPNRRRCCVMPVSASDGRERGRPSSWSAAVDQLAFGGDGEPKRLWILAAGNNDNQDAWAQHPNHLGTEEVHDPGQAWNALTVGAFTERWQIEEDDFEGWEPLAQPGGLGPNTTTSAVWQTSWPLKPDVVCEGGNAALSPGGEIDLPDSLSLLTTHHRVFERSLTSFGDTSAASALAARMAAKLQERYPEFWPETIRGLIAHSAVWTREMLSRYGPFETKKAYEYLVRCCGLGVPSLERALWSAENRLTLVAQEAFQPYLKKSSSSSATFNELQIYELPWPIQELRDLDAVDVELRVTLSYFIEPNPSERGYARRHRYASHGFRFELKAASETLEDFRKRINKAARDEGESSPGTGDRSGWDLGPKLRHKGSLHTDTWRGTAADLANRQHVAVYPVTGWWKERPQTRKWKQKARYALLVSIHAPEVAIDLYTPVAAQIGIPIEI